MSKVHRIQWLLLLLLGAVVLTGCDTKTISEVKSDPYKYENKDVQVRGVVTQSFAILNYGVYEIEDGTGKLFVVSERGVPSKGAHVGVKGRMVTAFSLAGVDYGTVLRESGRKIRNN